MKLFKIHFYLRSLLLTVVASAIAFVAVREAVPRRIVIVESLKNPIKINGWTEDGFLLENGKLLKVPGIRRLPRHSRILSLVRQYGLEINKKNQIISLVNVHPRRGEANIILYTKKFNLSHMMMFYREGEFVMPESIEISSIKGFVNNALDSSEFNEFEQFSAYLSWLEKSKHDGLRSQGIETGFE